MSVTEVRLEAEEDMTKYNRLVRYYEDLGFRRRKGAKVQYLNHCDQVYRKVRLVRFALSFFAARSPASQMGFLFFDDCPSITLFIVAARRR